MLGVHLHACYCCCWQAKPRQGKVWLAGMTGAHAQAEHEAGVTGVGVSPDGLRVAVGTENGALGVLDVPSHAYTTLLRSHTGVVNSVVMDPVRWVHQFDPTSWKGWLGPFGALQF